MAKRQPQRGEPLALSEGIRFFIIAPDIQFADEVAAVLHKPPVWNAAIATEPAMLAMFVGSYKPHIIVRQAGVAEDWNLPAPLQQLPTVVVEPLLNRQALEECVRDILASRNA